MLYFKDKPTQKTKPHSGHEVSVQSNMVISDACETGSISYEYLTTAKCMQAYPVIYNDAPDQLDKPNKYLVLHEIRDRYMNNWQYGAQWRQYKGVITWNPRVYEDEKKYYNMVFCCQFMNMYVERVDTYVPFGRRWRDVCCVYGSPASIDTAIMMARYDLPLRLTALGMKVDAYGVIPDMKRPEFRKQWHKIFRGALPYHGKKDALGKCKFSVAFENSRDPYYAHGWVTEKIYDCLGCGCIPIYWGANNITEYVPPEVFIDYRDFRDDNDLYEYLKNTPANIFSKMSRDGLEFFDSVHFDKYLDVFKGLPIKELAA